MKETLINIEKQMVELRKIYLEEIPDKLAGLEKHLKRFVEQPQDREALEQLAMGLHKLAGSAGSYGFKEAGTKACQLETELKCLLSGHVECDAARLGQIEKCFNEMKKYFHSDSSEQEVSPQEPGMAG